MLAIPGKLYRRLAKDSGWHCLPVWHHGEDRLPEVSTGNLSIMLPLQGASSDLVVCAVAPSRPSTPLYPYGSPFPAAKQLLLSWLIHWLLAS